MQTAYEEQEEKMAKLISNTGSLQYGFSKTPVGEVNYKDYVLKSPFGDILESSEKERQFVHFHFLGFASKKFIAGCSLSHTSLQTTAFFYLFDRETGEMLKRGCRARTEGDFKIAQDPDEGFSFVKGKGMEVSFNLQKNGLSKELLVRIDEKQVLHMKFEESAVPFETLRLTTPTGPTGWTYCQKVAGLKAEGHLVTEEGEIGLQDLGACAHHDFTAGFLRRDTFWNWACITGYDEQGRCIGLNLSNSVNETGHSENVIWVDGKLYPAGLIQFSYDRDNLSQPWEITSDTGAVKLHFRSEGKYTASNPDGKTPFDFHQLFGSFNGEVFLNDGRQLIIKDLPGFCERQYAIWY
ncbi:MAG: DUF2804 domain-containing protein [Sneathiellales bacterium]|nr:DUF2804 domain-containing protein [Sneathiellales bacterium]